MAHKMWPTRARVLVDRFGPEKAFHALDLLSVRGGVDNEGAYVAEVIEHGDAEELAEISGFIASQRAAEKGVAGSQPSLMMAGDEEEKDTGGELPLLGRAARAQELWEKVLEDAREQVDVSSLGVWFDGLWAVGLEDWRLIIGVPNAFAK